uniref:CSON003541 protein n=1 Tax=Culicoides sonorensis TaxID=179676 RepID=A0A336MRA5_CULSO
MAGEVFVVLPPATQPNLIIYGRVSYDECQEIIYFPSGAQPNIKLRNIEIEGKNSYGIILSKSNKAWGGLSGSNDKNVTIGLVYRKNESGILGDELLRLALERSSSAEDAIDTIAKLVNDYSKEPSKEEMPTYGFVICDPRSAWILNLVGSLWAAEKINDKFRWIGNGLTIETKIDKCSENLQEKCKSFLLWNGEVS